MGGKVAFLGYFFGPKGHIWDGAAFLGWEPRMVLWFLFLSGFIMPLGPVKS